MATLLTATWKNLALVTYQVPGTLLRDRLPPGCVLDRLAGDTEEKAYVSVVALDFLNTHVMGVPVPGYGNFPQINFRFYVRHGSEHGVCFIREFVPRRLVAGAAWWAFNEPYQSAAMQSETRQEGSRLIVRHQMAWEGQEHQLEISGEMPPYHPGQETREHFFKERHWGFGRHRDGGLVRYEVVHPEWDIYPVTACRVLINWEKVFGEAWGFLREATPFHVMLAVGSDVTVAPKEV